MVWSPFHVRATWPRHGRALSIGKGGARTGSIAWASMALLLALALGCDNRQTTAEPDVDPPPPPVNPPPVEPPPETNNDPVIQVQPAITHQTMLGWEVLPELGQNECSAQASAAVRGELLDRAVNEMGINRLRVTLVSGTEHNVDHFARFKAGQITFDEWKSTWFIPVNDNGDPRVINAAGFKFSHLDQQIDDAVLPLRQRLAARGERLYFNLAYTDFFNNTPFEQRDDPEEYAELILAAFQHIREKYSLVPDALEILIEPDNAAWNADQVAAAIAAAGDRLAAAGFRPAVIAPSTASTAEALTYIDRAMANPRARAYVTDFSYHRYSAASTANIQAIAARALQQGVRTAMLEYFPGTYRELHEDLTVGGVSAWQQFGLAFCGEDAESEGVLFVFDDRSRVQLTRGARYLQQYFRYVRLDAVRVGATTTESALEPVAFRNANGKYTVIVKAGRGGPFNMAGLPDGQYGITYTTPNVYNASLPDAAVSNGRSFSVVIPEASVVTIFAR